MNTVNIYFEQLLYCKRVNSGLFYIDNSIHNRLLRILRIILLKHLKYSYQNSLFFIESILRQQWRVRCLRRCAWNYRIGNGFSLSLEQNSKYFHEAREKLEKWADDMVLSAEKALKGTK